MTSPVLWHFPISHYNEKARWALDYKGIAHVRRGLLPGLHIPRVMWRTRQKSVPVLFLNGTPICDSTAIIAALERHLPDPPLYPRDENERRRALALEDFFDEELGPHIRIWLFDAILPHTDAAAAVMATGTGAVSRRVYRALFPAIRVAMKMDMKMDAAAAKLGERKVLEALDRLEAELQPSGYLVGDRFSVADLAAAALFAPLVIPAEFPYPLPELPPAAAALRASQAGRRGFRWVADTYRRHRGVSHEIAAS